MQIDQLVGKTTEHLTTLDDGVTSIHRELLPHWHQLQQSGEQVGIKLAIASGFRSYSRQLAIWNEKVMGKRALLNRQGVSIDSHTLSPTELLFTILHWSAIPGFSRHHWGCDIDIFDQAALPEDYKLQLTPEEYSPSGIFSRLTKWLPTIEQFNFFLPYRQKDRSGVQREPWHISYAPLAKYYYEQLNFDFFYQQIEQSEILLKESILQNAKFIYDTYIINIDE